MPWTREIALLCLLDLPKCFDVVPHDGLLRKLEMYSVDTGWFVEFCTAVLFVGRRDPQSWHHSLSRPQP